MLKTLCSLNGTSGDEAAVRAYILQEIAPYCTYEVDALGSIIAFKKGRKVPKKKVMLCAHMDEVGFIITAIDEDGYLSFQPVGGIDVKAVVGRVVTINGRNGVIGLVPVHLLTDEEKRTAPEYKKLRIDIGAASKAEALQYVAPGDYAYFTSNFQTFGDGFLLAKALDDRIGCMLLLQLLQSDLEYDTYFCFNVQEEVGLRGAACTAFRVQSDVSVVLEATTAADLCGVTGGERVCILGGGPVVSFMDGRTVYDRALYRLAFDVAQAQQIPIQTKTAIAGGNDAGAIQTSGKGSSVLAISLPCRYIHTGASVVKQSDIEETARLLQALLPKLYD